MSEPLPPRGKPIPGVTNLGDVEWALTRARRYRFRGGSIYDPAYREFIDAWLDYRYDLIGSPLEHLGETRELSALAGREQTTP